MSKAINAQRSKENRLTKLWHVASLVGTVSALASVSALLSDLSGAGAENISRSVIFLTFGTAAIFALISFFVFILQDRTEHISQLKEEVTAAFMKALDESSFNPRRLEENNEQSSPHATG